jgi:DNA-binding transcriptional MerR regulator
MRPRGLLPRAPRTAAGYRLYDRDDVDTLTFISRARSLDLSLDDIGAILVLRRGGIAPCPAVRDMLDLRLAEIDRAIAELQALRDSLTETRQSAATPAAGAAAAVCPIIER